MNRDCYRYQIGQEVTVRFDLGHNASYYMRSGYKGNHPNGYSHDGLIITDDMYALRGHRVHIDDYCEGYYRIKEQPRWKWADDMFEDPNKVCYCRSLL